MRRRLFKLGATKQAAAGIVRWSAAAAALRPRFEKVKNLEIQARSADSEGALHALRIEAKHFRYGLELLAPLHPRRAKAELQTLESLQSSLGHLHDATLWRTVAARFTHAKELAVTPAGVEWLLQRMDQRRQREFDQFAALWTSPRGKRQLATLFKL